ncbi:hypothetical protein BDY19DRAFT_930806 [Irpex rosettiformis]|uniref:Uncharacterized protein n=1 Tax=Irpex rosettiformis TaxID=378272 RepID=A0ACB8UB75_9APHY|nr:hypothetical protein BDY19DRAFT_930806 [Irpex rosettiformis]
MHPALLIAEVFEVILEHCSDWRRGEYQRTLGQLARSCKAWKDPSLDRLWGRLESADPLWRLYENLGHVNTSVSDVHSYTARIKHLTVFKGPSSPIENIFLPNLRSICLLRDACCAPVSFTTTQTLRELQVDLGPIIRTQAAESRGRCLVATLTRLESTGSRLEKLRIRGWIPPILSSALSSLRSLHSLTLSTGNSLTAGTLASFASFPNLQHLSVHASSIDAEDFTAALPPNASFASMHTLQIRASRSLICAILAIIPRDTLHYIHIEAEEFDQDPLAWKPTFDLLTSRAADTLMDLTIDQTLNPDEMESLEFLSLRSPRFTLETLRPLYALTALQRFTLDVMILPDLTDKDIAQMASWWPHLQVLDLGTLSGGTAHNGRLVAPKITLASLRSLAKRCRNLRTLVLPLDLTVNSYALEKKEEKIPAQTALHTLLLGGLPPADTDMSPFIRQILAIFPRLEEIECTSVDKSLYMDLSTSTGKDSMDIHAVMMDEFANGQ